MDIKEQSRKTRVVVSLDVSTRSNAGRLKTWVCARKKNDLFIALFFVLGKDIRIQHGTTAEMR